MGTFSYHPSFHALALDAIQRGLINYEQIITHTFPLEDIEAAFEMADGGSELKVVITGG
jgi:L-iditol 2-dehydrogenase